MRTKEIIINYNNELRKKIEEGINDPEFLKNLEKKIKEGKEQLTDCEGVICRDVARNVSTTQV